MDTADELRVEKLMAVQEAERIFGNRLVSHRAKLCEILGMEESEYDAMMNDVSRDVERWLERLCTQYLPAPLVKTFARRYTKTPPESLNGR